MCLDMPGTVIPRNNSLYCELILQRSRNLLAKPIYSDLIAFSVGPTSTQIDESLPATSIYR